MVASAHATSTMQTIGFLTRDPIGYEAGDLSLYRFVLGNSLLFVDPSGNQKGKVPPTISWDCSATTDSPSSATAATVICQNGSYEVVITPSGQNATLCEQECLKAHEEQHIDIFKRLCPNLCKGCRKKDTPYYVLHITKLPGIGYLENECIAYMRELTCLEQKLSDKLCNPSAIRERIKFVKEYMKDTLKCDDDGGINYPVIKFPVAIDDPLVFPNGNVVTVPEIVYE